MGLDVKGKVQLDGSGFTKTLSGLEHPVEHFARHIKRELLGAFMAAFGARAVIDFGKELLKQGHEITQLAAKFHLTTDEVQLLQKEAEETGVTFEELVKDSVKLEETLDRIRGGSPLLSHETVEQLEAYFQAWKTFKEEAGKDLFGAFVEGGNPLLTAIGLLTSSVLNWAKELGKAAEVINAKVSNITLRDRLNSFFGPNTQQFPPGYGVATPEGKAMAEQEAAAKAKQEAAAVALATKQEAQRSKEEKAKRDQLSAEKVLQDQRERASQLDFDTDELNEKTRLKKMTDANQLVALTKKRKDLESQIDQVQKLPGGEGDHLIATAGLKHDLAETNAAIADLQKKPSVKFGLNQFQQIGGYAGPDLSQDVSKKSLGALQAIERNTNPQADGANPFGR